MKKLVDGVEVELSPEEEAAFLADWAQESTSNVGHGNVKATSERTRADAIAAIERKLSTAPQSEINAALLQLLKVQS